MVRILVAVRALIEWNANVLRFAVCSVDVAFGALHLRVQAGQRISCLRMIELRLARRADIDLLPVHEVVARQAIRPETAFVLIFVAGDTSGGEAQVCAVQILDLDCRALLRRDV